MTISCIQGWTRTAGWTVPQAVRRKKLADDSGPFSTVHKSSPGLSGRCQSPRPGWVLYWARLCTLSCTHRKDNFIMKRRLFLVLVSRTIFKTFLLHVHFSVMQRKSPDFFVTCNARRLLAFHKLNWADIS